MARIHQSFTLNFALLYFMALLLTPINLRAQSNNAIIINQGNDEKSIIPHSGEIFINGISSKEDIGGVEVSEGKYCGYSCYNLYFTNYNNFPVTVVYIVHVMDRGSRVPKTGSLVLQPNESKFTRDSYCRPDDFRLIARRLNVENNSSQSQQTTYKPSAKQESLDGMLEKYGGYFYRYPTIVMCSLNEITPFINKLNSKKVYGRSNWRLATPIEAGMVSETHYITDLGTSETRPSRYEDDNKPYRFLIVCE